jgi:hypothetical protein
MLTKIRNNDLMIAVATRKMVESAVALELIFDFTFSVCAPVKAQIGVLRDPTFYSF